MQNFRLKPAALAISLACLAAAAHADDTPAKISESANLEQNHRQRQQARHPRQSGQRPRVRQRYVHGLLGQGGSGTLQRHSPADIFKGLVGVQSGDARNSGALDPNIRGIQGQGRVPVTVDGTEQAITVWRGYNGANNRNYIDPMLIGGMTIEKGPALSRDVANSVGGGVAIKTLKTDDILQEGKDFGIDVKVEASTNAVRPRWPSMQQGIKVQNDPNSGKELDFNYFVDPDLMHHAKKGGRYALGRDQAARIAIAKRWNDFDLMAAYVWRHKGNHYAGRNGSKYYRQDPASAEEVHAYTRYLAHLYYPGAEVPNTSSDMKSLLLKATWKPTPYQRLQLGWRDTRAEYGEIMPSRLGEGRYRLKKLEEDGYFNNGGTYSRFLQKYASEQSHNGRAAPSIPKL